jgi:hypothetical protein
MATDQIRQMVNFILQEAHEKANEIRVKVGTSNVVGDSNNGCLWQNQRNEREQTAGVGLWSKIPMFPTIRHVHFNLTKGIVIIITIFSPPRSSRQIEIDPFMIPQGEAMRAHRESAVRFSYGFPKQSFMVESLAYCCCTLLTPLPPHLLFCMDEMI